MALFKRLVDSKQQRDRRLENSERVLVEAPPPSAPPSTAEISNESMCLPPLTARDGSADPLPPPPQSQAEASTSAPAGLVVPSPPPPPPPLPPPMQGTPVSPPGSGGGTPPPPMAMHGASPLLDGQIPDHPTDDAHAPPQLLEGAPPVPLQLGGAPTPLPPLALGGSKVGRSSLKPLHWNKVNSVVEGSLWEELQTDEQPHSAAEIDVSELEELFSNMSPKIAGSKEAQKTKSSSSSMLDKVQLIDPVRANNTEIMLTEVNVPLPYIVDAVLAMDDTVVDVVEVESFLKFCPTEEEMEVLKSYTGDQDKLGKCERYFLELMKVPRMESKLNAFLFKIQFNSQLAEFKKRLNTVNSACDEVKNSVKFKEIMKRILYLGNTLNQGTARGAAVGFKLDSLLKLTETRASNCSATLMHYLCKLLATKSPDLIDFHEDFVSLEAAAEIQLKCLAEEMQALSVGLKKVKQELDASANDGPVSEGFHMTLKEFVDHAEVEVSSVTNFYHVVGRNADALALYFGEDPSRCPFEQASQIISNFVRLFLICHKENLEQAELNRKESPEGHGIEIIWPVFD